MGVLPRRAGHALLVAPIGIAAAVEAAAQPGIAEAPGKLDAAAATDDTQQRPPRVTDAHLCLCIRWRVRWQRPHARDFRNHEFATLSSVLTLPMRVRRQALNGAAASRLGGQSGEPSLLATVGPETAVVSR